MLKDLKYNKSLRFNRDYYNNIIWHFKESLKDSIRLLVK